MGLVVGVGEGVAMDGVGVRMGVVRVVHKFSPARHDCLE